MDSLNPCAEAPTPTDTCAHCEHPIALAPEDPQTWIATDAPQTPEDGDDHMWRDYCPDNHTERAAPHEPTPTHPATQYHVQPMTGLLHLDPECSLGTARYTPVPTHLPPTQVAALIRTGRVKTCKRCIG